VQALLNFCSQHALETTFVVVGVAATNIQMVAGQGQQASSRRRAQQMSASSSSRW